MTEPTITERMAALIAIGQQGDRHAAREGLAELWEETTGSDPVVRCGIAHSLADVSDDLHTELEWDMKALALGLDATDGDVAALGMQGGTAGLMPSLHLNLADVYRRLGEQELARGHALRVKSALTGLDSNPYFETIATAADRILAGLDGDD